MFEKLYLICMYAILDLIFPTLQDQTVDDLRLYSKSILFKNPLKAIFRIFSNLKFVI